MVSLYRFMSNRDKYCRIKWFNTVWWKKNDLMFLVIKSNIMAKKDYMIEKKDYCRLKENFRSSEKYILISNKKWMFKSIEKSGEEKCGLEDFHKELEKLYMKTWNVDDAFEKSIDLANSVGFLVIDAL